MKNTEKQLKQRKQIESSNMTNKIALFAIFVALVYGIAGNEILSVFGF